MNEYIGINGWEHAMWGFKFIICVIIDILDFTVGRLLIFTPLVGEAIGVTVGCMLFGSKGLFYLLEGIDFTEQIDGFVPTATIIALGAREDEAKKQNEIEVKKKALIQAKKKETDGGSFFTLIFWGAILWGVYYWISQ